MHDKPNSSSARLKAARSRQSARRAGSVPRPAVPTAPAPHTPPEPPREELPYRRLRRERRPRGPMAFVVGLLILAVCGAGLWGGISLCQSAQEEAGMTGPHPTPAGTPQAGALSAAPETTPQAVDVSPAPAAALSSALPEATPAPDPTPEEHPSAGTLTGDWLSDPDAETYAEVIRLQDNGSCSMMSTMVEDEGTTGWRDGTWYTSPVGEGIYTYADNELTFTLSTPDGMVSYRYVLTWLSENRFSATIYIQDTTPHCLVFTRIP